MKFLMYMVLVMILKDSLIPLLQANAIKLALEDKEISANVYVAMRYWHPFTEEAVHQASSIKRKSPALHD